MFETAELGRSVGKEEFEAELPKLRLELLEAQRELQEAGVPVIVLLGERPLPRAAPPRPPR